MIEGGLFGVRHQKLELGKQAGREFMKHGRRGAGDMEFATGMRSVRRRA